MALLSLTGIVTAYGLLRIQRLRARSPSDVALIDLVTGIQISLWVGAFFEGYLLGVFNFQIFVLYIFSALVKQLLVPNRH